MVAQEEKASLRAVVGARGALLLRDRPPLEGVEGPHEPPGRPARGPAEALLPHAGAQVEPGHPAGAARHAHAVRVVGVLLARLRRAREAAVRPRRDPVHPLQPADRDRHITPGRRAVAELAGGVAAPGAHRAVRQQRQAVVRAGRHRRRGRQPARLHRGVGAVARAVAELAGAVLPPRPDGAVGLHRQAVGVPRRHADDAGQPAHLHRGRALGARPGPQLARAVVAPGPGGAVGLARHAVAVRRTISHAARAKRSPASATRRGWEEEERGEPEDGFSIGAYRRCHQGQIGGTIVRCGVAHGVHPPTGRVRLTRPPARE